MDSERYELVVATFTHEKGAQEALKQLEAAAKDKSFKIEEAAVLFVDEKEQLKIKETGDSSGSKGAVIGGVIGGAIGLIGGPLAIATGAAGAAIGGMAARMSDSGFPDEQLKLIGRTLRPGMSTIVALVQLLGEVDLEAHLNAAGAHSVKHESLDKALLTPSENSSRVRADFFEMAAGATAVNLMGEIARDENQPSAEPPPADPPMDPPSM